VFTIDSGTLVVQLSDQANGYVIADAVRIEEAVLPTAPLEIIDDVDLEFVMTGTGWTGAASATAYGDDMHYHTAGSGANAATWTFERLDPTKHYEVFATWSAYSNRATNAPYTVLDGTTAQGLVRVNQQLAPDEVTYADQPWKSLGVFSAASGTLVVQLTDEANGYVIADAIRVAEALPPTVPPEIIDDGDLEFGLVGTGWAGAATTAGYEEDMYYHAAGSGSNKATWTFDMLPAGTYEIFVTWSQSSNRATDAPFTVWDGSTAEALVGVNQQLAPADVNYADQPWESLGVYVIDSGTLVVELSDQANGYVIADAVRIVEGVLPEAPLEIIDDVDAEVTLSGTGWTGAASATAYGDDMHYHAAGSGANTVTWTFERLDPAKHYEVLATWSASSNRATNAPFAIRDDATALGTVRVNQQLVPDDVAYADQPWESLGVFSFASGTLVVELTDQANGYVIADAIYVREALPPTDPKEIIDDGDLEFSYSGTGWAAAATTLGYEQDMFYHAAGSGANAGTWSFERLTPGTYYEVFATWSPYSNRATNAPFTVWDGAAALGTVRVNQELTPDDATYAGQGWKSLGVFQIVGDTLVVELTDQANGYVIADAIRVVESVPPTGPKEIIDDGDLEFSTSGTGWSAAATTLGYEGDMVYHAAGSGTNKATWQFDRIPAGSAVTVFATWAESSNRATNAQYGLFDGTTARGTATVDQRLAPDDAIYAGQPWEMLGSVVVESGTLRVELSDLANGYVIADAVRIEVTLPGNVAPMVYAGADAAIDEGDTFVRTGSFVDPDPDSWTATVDYGDGTPAGPLTLNPDKTFELNHVYAEDGTYTLTVTVDDGTYERSDSVVVAVSNVVPTADPGGPYSVAENQSVTFDASGTFDPGGDIVSYRWDLNHDGVYDDAIGLSFTMSAMTLNLLGVPTNGTPWDIGLQVTDDDGAVGTATTTLTIENVAPTADAGGPYTVNEGSAVTLDASGSFDLADGIVLYRWDLDGDGAFDDASGVHPTVSWATLSGLGIPTDGTAAAITVQVTDGDGATATAATTLTIENVAPTADAGGPYSVVEGQGIALDGGASSDPADAISYAWDLDGDGLYDDASGVNPAVSWATFAGLGLPTNGTAVTIGLLVSDTEGATATATTSLTIENAAPVAVGGGPYAISEGESIALSAAGSSDPGGDALVGYAWDLDGDGAFDDATGASPTVDWATLAGLGLPSDGSPIAIAVAVTDSDGGVGTGTATLYINNLSPSPDADGPYAIDEGASLVLDAQATSDPGGDMLSYAWDLDNDGAFDDATGIGPTVAWATLLGLGLASDGTATPIALRATDSDGAVAVAVSSLTIRNVAPAADAGGAYAIEEGQSLVLDAGGSSDPGGDALSYAWDLDADGQYDDAVGVNPTVPWNVFAGLGLASDGTLLAVGLRVTDADGAASTAATTLTIANIAPTADAGGPYVIDEGQSLLLDGTGSSDAGDPITGYAWDLDNDGQYDDATGENPTISWSSLVAMGLPSDGTPVAVSVQVTDADGAASTSATTLTINNLAPIANAGGPYTMNEGGSVTLDGSASSDPVDAIVLYEWDLDGDGQFDDATGVTAVFDADDDGAYEVGLRVTDDDGAWHVNMTMVVVSNVPPTLQISGEATAAVGEVYTLSLSSSDPGADTIQYWTIVWEEGGDPETVPNDPASATHTYQAGGQFTITATATDEDGTYSANSLVVDVASGNTAPVVVTPIADVTVDEDAPATAIDLFANFEDAQDADTLLTYEVVGNTNAGLVSTAWAGIGQLDLTYAANASGTADITVRVTDTGGLFVEDTFTVTVAAVNDAPTATTIPDVTVAISAAPVVVDLKDYFSDVESTVDELTYTVVRNRASYFAEATLETTPGPDYGKLTLTFAADTFGTGTITLRATDPGGLFVEGTFTVTVTGGEEPAINGPSTTDEGDVYTLALNSGSVAVTGWEINWGDGNTETIDGDPSSATHVYADGDNDYTITAVASDGVNTYPIGGTGGGGTEWGLDGSFGLGGRVATSMGEWTSDQAYAMAVQADGKIVMGGTDGYSWVLARYGADGALDPTFGTGGITSVYVGGYEGIQDIAILADGKILAVGDDGYDFLVSRFNADGTLDTSFGSGGTARTDLASYSSQLGYYSYDRAYAVAVAADGDFFVAGVTNNYGSYSDDFAVVRYNPDGTVDTSFGDGGVAATDFGSGSEEAARGLALTADGKVVLAGYTYNSATSSYDFAAVRYNADGSLDTGFDGDGIVTLDLGGTEQRAYDVAVDAVGKVVLAGYTYSSSSSYDFAVVRLNADGGLDTGFDADGVVTTGFGGTSVDQAYSVALEDDGDIVVAGTAHNDFAVVRYQSDGTPDADFGTGGQIATDFAGGSDRGRAVLTDTGAILVGGTANVNGYDRFAVARYAVGAGGTVALDTTFGAEGKVTTSISTYDEAWGMAVQADGKIVVVGQGGSGYWGLVRYDATGALDTTFDGDGKASFYMGGSARDVAIQADGKIVVVGNSSSGFTVARYVVGTGGTVALDTTFDGDGKVFVTAGYYAYAYGLVIAPDGDILVAGSSYSETSYSDDFVVIRLNADGSLDAGFGTGGIATTDFGSNYEDVAYDIALGADGKVVLAGYTYSSTTWTYDFAVARYNADGSLDGTFGAGGKATASFGDYTEERAYGVALDADGRAVVVGYTYSNITYTNEFAVARFDSANGTLDASFGTDGRVTTAFDFASSGTAYAVTVEPDDDIVVVGSAYIAASTSDDFAVVRYRPDGTLDPEFASGGRATTDLAGKSDAAHAVAIDAVGNILVAGTAGVGSYTDFAIVRYLSTPPTGGGLPVTVENVAPTLTISGTSTAPLDHTYTLGLSAVDPGEDTITQWTIDWGDGTAPEAIADNPLSANHVYATVGDFTISATASDEDGTFSANALLVMVVNNAPVVAVPFDDVDVVMNDPATMIDLKGHFSDVEDSPDALTYELVANTNPDLVAATLETTSGPTYGQLTLSYAPDLFGVAEITIRGTDTGGLSAEATFTVIVGGGDTVLIAGLGTVDEGSVYTLRLNPGPVAVPSGWEINWGDGTGVETISGSPLSVTHTYADGPATVVISASVSDGATSYPANDLAINVPNVAPTLAISGAATAGLNETYVLSLASSDPGDDVITQWTIDWGDGTAPEVITGNPFSTDHVYATAGDFAISATATDEDGIFAANALSASVAPIITISGAAQGDEGSIYTLNLSAAGITPTEWRIDWGDGTSLETIAGNPPSVTRVLLDGTQSVTVVATAVSGLGAFGSNALAVEVLNVAPMLTIRGAPATDEGSVYTLGLSAVDPGADTIAQWLVDWDDGTVQTVPGNPSSVTHVYPNGPAAYAITATATDEDGTYASNSLGVTVSNVAPTADAGGPYTVDEGSEVTLDASGSYDPGNDIVLYEWNLDGDGQYDDAVGVTSTFSTTVDGAYTVQVRITDDDGDSATASAIVTVDNVAPTANAGGPYMGNAGDDIALSAAASTDPGNDIVLYQWDLDNDGQYDDATGVMSTFSATVDGAYTVRVRVTDDDGASATASATVTVGNAPTANAGGPYMGSEGSDIALSAAASTDPGDDIIFYEWDLDNDGLFDDAAGVEVEFLAPDDGTYTVGLKVTDNTGGTSTDTATVTVWDVAPTVLAVGDQIVDIGETLVLTDLATFTDPGFDDPLGNPATYETFTYSIDWGDGTGFVTGDATVDIVGQTGVLTEGSLDGSHQYASQGVYMVTVKVTDDDRRSGIAAFLVYCGLSDTPTSVAATAISNTSVDLSWVDNSSDELGFSVEQSTDGRSFDFAGWVSADATSHTVAGLAPGTQYWFRVVASDGVNRAPSRVTTATTSANLPLAPTSVTVDAALSNEVQLSWTPNPASEQDGFKIEQSEDGEVFAEVLLIADPTCTMGTVAGLSPSTAYYFRTRAYNGVGDSGYSDAVETQTTAAAPGTPTDLIASAVSSSEISLTWTNGSSDQDGFRVERSTDGEEFIEVATAWESDFVVDNLAPGTEYFFRICAYNSIGDSDWSNTDSATTIAATVVPNAPTGLIATALSDDAAVELAWLDASDNEAGFRIERSLDGVDFTEIATTLPNCTTWTATTLVPNTQYYFRIQAFNGVGDSGYATDDAVTANVAVAPVVATAAAASLDAAKTTASLSVLGADDDAETTLTYTWAATMLPPEADTPQFSVNGTNAAKDSTATFSAAGTYWLTVTITDEDDLSTTSSVLVTVDQVAQAISVSPSTVDLVELNAGGTQQFTAAGIDQFGNDLTSSEFTWSVTSGGGTIDGDGLYTAANTSDVVTVNVELGLLSDQSTITVTNLAPAVAVEATAAESLVTSASTTLTVLGADDADESNLTYTWSVTSKPVGADDPTFTVDESVNGTNAAKDALVTFSGAGDYQLAVTITDAGGLTITSDVAVTVEQTLTSVTVEPGTVSVDIGGTQQFTAQAFDQFGGEMTTPAPAWAATGGTITVGGLFTAPNGSIPVTVSATCEGVTGSVLFTVTNSAPTTSLRTGDGATVSLWAGALGDPGGVGAEHLSWLSGQADVVLSSYVGSFTVSRTSVDVPASFVPPTLAEYHHHPDQTQTNTVATVGSVTYDQSDVYEIDFDLTIDGNNWTYTETANSTFTVTAADTDVISTASGSYGYTFTASGDGLTTTYTWTITTSATAGAPDGSWTQTTETADTIVRGSATRAGSGSTTSFHSANGIYSDSSGGTMEGTTSLSGSNSTSYDYAITYTLTAGDWEATGTSSNSVVTDEAWSYEGSGDLESSGEGFTTNGTHGESGNETFHSEFTTQYSFSSGSWVSITGSGNTSASGEAHCSYAYDSEHDYDALGDIIVGTHSDNGSACVSYSKTISYTSSEGIWHESGGSGTASTRGTMTQSYSYGGAYFSVTDGDTTSALFSGDNYSSVSYNSTIDSVSTGGDWSSTGSGSVHVQGRADESSSTHVSFFDASAGWEVGGTLHVVVVGDGTYETLTDYSLDSGGLWKEDSGNGDATFNSFVSTSCLSSGDYSFSDESGSIIGASQTTGNNLSILTMTLYGTGSAGTWTTNGLATLFETGDSNSSYSGLFTISGEGDSGDETGEFGKSDQSSYFSDINFGLNSGEWQALTGMITTSVEGGTYWSSSTSGPYLATGDGWSVSGAYHQGWGLNTDYDYSGTSMCAGGIWSYDGTGMASADGLRDYSYAGAGPYAGAEGTGTAEANGYDTAAWEYTQYYGLDEQGDWQDAGTRFESSIHGRDNWSYSITDPYTNSGAGWSVEGTQSRGKGTVAGYDCEANADYEDDSWVWEGYTSQFQGVTAHSSYDADGTYTRSVNGGTINGTVSDVGQSSSELIYATLATLNPDATWNAPTVAKGAADRTTNHWSYEGNGEYSRTAANDYPYSVAGTVSESGDDLQTAEYVATGTLMPNGTWSIQGTGRTFVDTRSNYEYSGDGTYSDPGVYTTLSATTVESGSGERRSQHAEYFRPTGAGWRQTGTFDSVTAHSSEALDYDYASSYYPRYVELIDGSIDVVTGYGTRSYHEGVDSDYASPPAAGSAQETVVSHGERIEHGYYEPYTLPPMLEEIFYEEDEFQCVEEDESCANMVKGSRSINGWVYYEYGQPDGMLVSSPGYYESGYGGLSGSGRDVIGPAPMSGYASGLTHSFPAQDPPETLMMGGTGGELSTLASTGGLSWSPPQTAGTTDTAFFTSLAAPAEPSATSSGSSGAFVPPSIVFDADGRLTRLTDANGGLTRLRYDAYGNLASLTDPVGNTTQWMYDSQNRVTQETDALGASRYFTYGAAGDLVRYTDRNGRVRQFEYDSDHHVTSETWYTDTADAGAHQNAQNTIQCEYDSAGRIVSESDDFSSVIYVYNEAGQILSTTQSSVDGPTVTLHYQYDTCGRRTQMAATIDGTADFVDDYGYDELGRVVSVTEHGVAGGNAVAEKRIELAYNEDGQLASIDRYQDGQLAVEGDYSYDGDGRLVGLVYHQGDTILNSYTWTYSGNGSRLPLGEGQGEGASLWLPTGGLMPIYDTTGITDALMSGGLAGLDLLTSCTSVDGTVTYNYDSTGQLIGASYTGGQPDECYTWDANGNPTGSGYVIGPGNRLLCDGTFRYEYDPEGSRTARFIDTNGNGLLDSGDTDITSYGWDVRNRLTSVTTYATFGEDPTQIVEFRYDAENRMIAETVDLNGDGLVDHQTCFAYDGNQIAVQFDKDGTGDVTTADLSHRYLWGPAVDQILADEQVTEGGMILWPLTDQVGSVRDLAQYDPASGVTSVANHLVYDTFGRLESQTNAAVACVFGFTGRPSDGPTGLQNNLNRWYEPTTGRWASEDPIWFEGDDANLYRYVRNAPANRVDPYGLQAPATIGDILGITKPEGLTDTEKRVLELAGDDEQLRADLMKLLDIIRNMEDPPLSWWDYCPFVGEGYCFRWRASLDEKLNAAGLWSAKLNWKLMMPKYIGWIPGYTDHGLIEIKTPNGSFYVDRRLNGGPGHISFELRKDLVDEDSEEYAKYLRDRARAWQALEMPVPWAPMSFE